MIYDLIIVGMGPAGVSAAIYAKRAGLSLLCLDKSMIGGTLNYIDRIDNYPGFYNITGPELSFKMYDQLKELEVEFKNKNVLDVEDGIVKKVITENEIYECKNVIIATGRVSRSLGLENEDELLGKGISHCALCDGALYKDKVVAVVGGGNSALSEALYLSSICKKVYLIHRRNEFSVKGQIVNDIKSKQNVEFFMERKIAKLNKLENKLSSIELDNGIELEIACLFSYVGYVPGTKFATSLDIADERGYILVDEKCMTKINGIYAVGDIIKKDLYQIVNAAAEGAIAATDIANKLRSE